MAIISVRDLNKSYINNQILRDVSFHIEEGDKVGLVGNNGSGKTSLFKILAGQEDLDSGSIYIQEGYEPAYMEQHTRIDSTKTIFEEALSIFEEIFAMEDQMSMMEETMVQEAQDPKKVEEILEAYMKVQKSYQDQGGPAVKSRTIGVLKGLGFDQEDLDKALNTLSGGQKSRVQLAKLLLSDPSFMILDEPTNHLDIGGITWLESYLKNFKGTFMVISHDRFFLDRTVDRVFLIDNKKLTTYKGNYTNFVRIRKKEVKDQAHQYKSQQDALKKEEEIIERYLSSGKKNIFKQGQSRKRRLENMLKDDDFIDPVKEDQVAQIRFTTDVKAGHIIFQAEDLSKSYDKKIFENISFEVTNGDRIGIVGPNGVGKTSLLKILQGQEVPDSGQVKLGSNVKIGYFDQEMADLDPTNTVIDEIWDAFPRLTHLEVRSYLAKMNFKKDEVFDEISILSGGEKSRISLLKLMLSGSNVLLMDEPTNHLDIDSKEVLEEALKDFDGTVIAISHDRYFLNNFAKKIWEMSADKITEYLGDYDYYQAKKQSLKEEDGQVDEISQTQRQKMQKKKRQDQRQAQKLGMKIKALEEQIQDLEDQIQAIDDLLYNPEISADYQRALDLSQERGQIQEDLDRTFEAWADLVE